MEKVSTCHVDKTLHAIGGKWKLIILWHLAQGTLRFSELEKRITGVTQKMLAQSLRELESDQLVLRTAYPVIPPKVEYSITKRGHSLRKILEALDEWGERNE